ncbi:MAG: heme exporter protein CcmB [Actinobacteria bacterium]|nr:heme exporter protein CcmB [Actinomycetota bacterium]
MSAVPAPGARGWAGKTLLLARKDLVIEVRGRDTLPPMLVFSLAVTLLLAFTLPDTSRPSARVVLPVGTASVADVLAGFLWVTVLFAGLVGFARSFEVERHEGAIDALLLVPLDRSGLYLAKAMTNLAFIVAVELFLFPVFAVLFPIGLGAGVVAVVVLVDVGFVAIGTLFAALAAQTRSRELMLPVLAFPVLVPVFIAAVELTSDLFLGRPTGVVVGAGWFGILVAFDLIYAVVGALAFEYVIE